MKEDTNDVNVCLSLEAIDDQQPSTKAAIKHKRLPYIKNPRDKREEFNNRAKKIGMDKILCGK